MSTWLFTIGQHFGDHWDVAQENLVWDTTTKRRVAAGDDIYFWHSGTGFVGRAQAAAPGHTLEVGTPLPWRDDDDRTYVWRIELHRPETLSSINLEDYAPLVELKKRLNVVGSSPLKEHYVTALDEAFGEATYDAAVDAALADLDTALAGEEELASLRDDQRQRVMERFAVIRESQARFRRRLIERDGGTCVVTGCRDRQTLQAAHIEPYRGDQSNHLYNGLTLRADIHTLFDKHLLTVVRVDTSWTIRVSPELESEDYRRLDGMNAQVALGSDGPHPDLLRAHNDRCGAWLT